MSHRCPVCGFELGAPAYDDAGRASFDICPACGVQYGCDDATRSHDDLRAAWVEAGMRWWSTAAPPPAGWDPARQLRDLAKKRDAARKRAIDIQGFEYDWLACDADGHVALFTTAGGGYAPPEFLEDTDAHDAAIEAIIAESRPDDTDTWRAVAARGLFAFDSDYYGGPYRLVAAPDVPASWQTLPLLARNVVSRIRFSQLRFAAASTITAEELQGRKPPG